MQIGPARLANWQGYPVIASFERLALPVFNPVLSDYFTKLTGVTNADLASGGEPLAGVIGGFAGFVGQRKSSPPIVTALAASTKTAVGVVW